MQWAKRYLPESSRFLVITGEAQDGIDAISEWFPALTGHISMATSQGYEWMPEDVFRKRKRFHTQVQSCIDQSVECLQDLINPMSVAPEYLFLSSREGVKFEPA